MENLTLPDFSTKFGNWIIEQYDNKRETWCKNPEGKTFIIKLTTEDIKHIPYYVMEELERYKLLDDWKTYQRNLALTRLYRAIGIYQNFLENKQEIPTNSSIVQIPLALPYFGEFEVKR